MERTYLIQRVTKPRHSPLGIMNPFSFGAGGGRLSEKAMELLGPVMNFDYMMAAEYEFGAVPAALNKIYQNAVKQNLFFSALEIKTKDVKLKNDKWTNWTPRKWKNCLVYIIGSKDDQAEIERRVRLLATDEARCMADNYFKYAKKDGLHEGMYVRDYPRLNEFIKYEPTYDDHVVGGLELDNGFFYTADKEMAVAFGKLFGIELQEA